MKQEKIDIILVHWGSQELTKLCIKTLLTGTKVPFRIILVNNTPEELQKAKDAVELQKRMQEIQDFQSLAF